MTYHLFAGRTYYPRGGMEDYVGSFDTEKSALIAYDVGGDDYQWGQIAITTDQGIMPISENPRESAPFTGWGPWTPKE